MKSNRKFKLQPRTVFRKYDQITVPELLLKGKWLQEAGFKPGQDAHVEVYKNRIVIRRS
jgi:toxic protein SymE